ncbi:MAG: L-histidine N(alpha)-methyltransferase [Rhodobacteraceae bacterium]|jgi:dimethylhistidine N-methyltransferase|nr:L-histidine N(alpha)-methyltransferase [Paracoccaceae bacterium]
MNRTAGLNADLLKAALTGLTGPDKSMDPKWFYDRAGSALFERITRLPEYYPTRTETAILTAGIARIAAHVPKGSALVELGSGASVKTRILLDGLHDLAAYLPVDVSESFLRQVAADLDRAYPALPVVPIIADFMAPLRLPAAYADHPKVGFFPGSTIGNLEPDRARALLASVRQWPGIAAFIVGIDLVKDVETLVQAYDDAAGVTAAFNRNLLVRLNREAGARFDPDTFDHEARWNPDLARMEMHLVSRVEQGVAIGPGMARFAAGESIHTESSHKYTRDSFDDLARAAGWRRDTFLSDAQDHFAVTVLLPG